MIMFCALNEGVYDDVGLQGYLLLYFLVNMSRHHAKISSLSPSDSPLTYGKKKMHVVD